MVVECIRPSLSFAPDVMVTRRWWKRIHFSLPTLGRGSASSPWYCGRCCSLLWRDIAMENNVIGSFRCDDPSCYQG